MTDHPLHLPSLDQLIQDGQPQFGVFSQVKSLNYLDYHSHLISQKAVPKWRKLLKVNQFAFIQMVHGCYRICIAVATIKLASTAFVYIYNDKMRQLEVIDAIRPLFYQSSFEGDHRQGSIQFNHINLTVELHSNLKNMTLKVQTKKFELHATFTRAQSPLAVCTPSGRRGWTFTQKEPLLNIQGQLTFKMTSRYFEKNKTIEFDESTQANLDWTLGYMRHVTNWFWSCINTKLSDGRQFLLNLSMGVNETGVSENALWLDGDILYLPPVIFQRNEPIEGQKQVNKLPWHIYHQHLGWSMVEIELTFHPIAVYKKKDDYGVIASRFEQWIGMYSGTIKVADESIKLNKVMGLAEDHYAKW